MLRAFTFLANGIAAIMGFVFALGLGAWAAGLSLGGDTTGGLACAAFAVLSGVAALACTYCASEVMREREV